MINCYLKKTFRVVTFINLVSILFLSGCVNGFKELEDISILDEDTLVIDSAPNMDHTEYVTLESLSTSTLEFSCDYNILENGNTDYDHWLYQFPDNTSVKVSAYGKEPLLLINGSFTALYDIYELNNTYYLPVESLNTLFNINYGKNRENNIVEFMYKSTTFEITEASNNDILLEKTNDIYECIQIYNEIEYLPVAFLEEVLDFQVAIISGENRICWGHHILTIDLPHTEQAISVETSKEYLENYLSSGINKFIQDVINSKDYEGYSSESIQKIEDHLLDYIEQLNYTFEFSNYYAFNSKCGEYVMFFINKYDNSYIYTSYNDGIERFNVEDQLAFKYNFSSVN